VPESLAIKQVRLVLEQQCRDIAEVIAKHLPAGTAFCLLLADFGAEGNTAFVSNAERSDTINLLEETIEHMKNEGETP
jgi:hypothetical protein